MRSIKSISVKFLCLCVPGGGFFACVPAPPPPPDLIFHNGPVITMTAPNPAGAFAVPGPAAVLVQNGKIAALGSVADIMERKTDATRVIDLKGRALLPGFIAAHTHPELSAYLHGFVDMSGFSNRTPAAVRARLDAAVKAAEPGEWIFCRGFDPMLVPGLKAPHISELDKIAPDNPVAIISQSLHSAWANTRAFQELNITPATPDPAPGSFYEKDSNGKLTGFISEVAAIGPFTEQALGVIDIKSNMLQVLRDYAKQGITSIATAGLFGKDSGPFILLEHLSSRSPGLMHDTLQTIGMLPPREPAVRNFIYVKSDMPELLPDSPDNGDDFFKVVGVKLWYDGSPYTGSMYLTEPYKDSQLMREGLHVAPGSRGKAVLTREEFRWALRLFHKDGWQIAIHTQGDQAAVDVLAELEDLLKEQPREDHRHRLEHGLLIPADRLARLKELGLTPSFHINHLYYYGEALRDGIIGPARANTILAAGSTARQGLRFTLHADQPMYAEDPRSMMATAISRRTRGGSVLGPAEAIDAYTALRTVTTDAAWQLGMEEKLGTIEIGKYADLVVLEASPLAVTPDRLRTLKVEHTFVAGREIYTGD